MLEPITVQSCSKAPAFSKFPLSALSCLKTLQFVFLETAIHPFITIENEKVEYAKYNIKMKIGKQDEQEFVVKEIEATKR